MRKLLALALALGLATPALAQNYQATQGSGTTFGSKLVTAVNYPQQMMCDPTTPANCVAVNASGQITVLGSGNFTVVNGGTFATQSAQSGTWTVQPGNTANTTAWLVTGTGGTFPATQSGTWNITNVSGTVSLPTGASTSANQTSQITQETATATGVGTPTDAVATSPASASSATMIALLKALLNTGQYPAGATAITASATGTTAATTATLAGTASKTTYICGLSIRANATAAATGNATVTGTITGTLNFTQWTAPLASGLGVTEQIFNPCVPASATNTGIAIISAAPGSGGVVSSTSWGYQL